MELEWDAEDLRASISKRPTGFNQTIENELLEIFQPFCPIADVLSDNLPVLHRPGVVLDSAGRILAWALPGILSKTRQVSTPASVGDCTKFVQDQIIRATEHLKSNITIDYSKPADSSRLHVGWRTGPAFFQNGQDWPAGTWLATPAGYAIGHQVSLNRRW